MTRRLRRFKDDGVVYPQTDGEDDTVRTVHLPPYPDDDPRPGDEVRLKNPPAGWSEVTGWVKLIDHVPNRPVVALVRWSNGKTCYEHLDRMTQVDKGKDPPVLQPRGNRGSTGGPGSSANYVR